uniref:Fibronectin type-III domain-containing protein n=1 Tax=Astatotilapia calliptera TaxID=8154 RepID=A0A3P8PDK1_ASTCA
TQYYECVSLCFCPAGGADGSEVPPPQNVITKTLNTNYTLSWDWPPGAAGTHAVTFTTQYVPKHQLKRKTPNWITACNQTSHRSCDLTRFKLLFIGDFMLRVRATVDGRHSEWAQKTFCPYEEGKYSAFQEVFFLISSLLIKYAHSNKYHDKHHNISKQHYRSYNLISVFQFIKK